MVRFNSPLSQRVESQIRRTTSDRIRHLTVEEIQGRVHIRGRAPTQHAKQLALHGALELLPGDRLHTEIAVG